MVDQTLMNEMKDSIKPALEQEVVYLNNRQKDFDKINEAFKALSIKNVKVLIDKANYRMGSLANAHKYSNVANQQEVENNTTELNQIVAELNNEILDIENIGIEMGTKYDEPKYQKFAEDIAVIIDKTLGECNETVRNATEILNNKFDSYAFKENVVENVIEETTDELKERLIEEQKIEEINPTEIKTDSIEELEKDLNKDLEPIQEDKKELEEAKQDLEGAIPVTSVEAAPEATIAPVLMPQENPDLDSFLNQGPIQNEVKDETPVVDEPKEVKQEVVNANSVDEGYVHVDFVEEFGLEEDKEQEGPVLQRTA